MANFSFSPQQLFQTQLALPKSPFLTRTTKPISDVSPKSKALPFVVPLTISQRISWKPLHVVASEEASSSSSSEFARRLYIGNIPRSLRTEELRSIVEEHGAAEKVEVMHDKFSGRSRRFGFATMKTLEDAKAVIEKLNGTEIGGRQIKVNVSEKPLPSVDLSLIQAEESQFIDSPHKVYVGNLAETVTTDVLKSFFSEKVGKVLSAKVSRVPGTSKSTGFGFVTFSADEDVEAAITSLNNAVLGGQKIRVNKA